MIIVLTLKTQPPLPGGPDEWQRLRRLLKCLLRTFGMKCIGIRRDDSDE